MLMEHVVGEAGAPWGDDSRGGRGIVEARLVPGWTLGPRRAGRGGQRISRQMRAGGQSRASPPRAERSWDPGSHRSPPRLLLPGIAYSAVEMVLSPAHLVWPFGGRKAIHDPSPPMPAPHLHYSCENSPLSTALHDCQASSVPMSNSHDFQNYL